MFRGMWVTVKSTGIKGIINAVLAGGVIVVEGCETGQKMTVTELDLEPFALVV